MNVWVFALLATLDRNQRRKEQTIYVYIATPLVVSALEDLNPTASPVLKDPFSSMGSAKLAIANV